ncbi:DNA internalization-related competence protein ComEC/Rec2 [Lactobacillus sp. ESL0791]|uniref:DNA internalization-related competence protein ComEC/Rec2 n=1 Tax=Lactobacillus sp. ESL0791 TaxID=2983234 RepID=UPI0035ABB447
MQRLKTTWKSDCTSPGLFALIAFLLAALSCLLFQSSTLWQKLLCLSFGGYVLFLLAKKYSRLIWMLSGILIVFVIAAGFQAKPQRVVLTADTVIKVYPDEVKCSDDWLSGTGYVGKRKILFSATVTPQERKTVRSGKILFLKDLSGEIDPIEPATNYGQFDYQKFYAGKNIFQKIKLKSFRLVAADSTDLFAILHKFRFNLQMYFKRMPRILGFFASELLLAENPESENQAILDNYRNLGVIHLLSISGLHVGIYTLVLGIFCSWLKFTEEGTFALNCLLLLLGIFLSGGQAGFIRASLAYFLGKIFKFKNIRLTNFDLLGLTLIIHLLFVPRLLLGVGAVLSYVLALGLQLTSKMSSFKQSVALNFLLTPLLLFYFFQFNFLTVLFNLLVVPYFNWVVMPVTFINLLLFPVYPALSRLLELVLENGEQVIAKVSATKLGLFTFGKINWWQCLGILVLTIIYLSLLNEGNENKRLRLKLCSSLLLSYTLCFCLIHFPLTGQVTLIDVGQGDSILITTPFPRKTYMIDTGGKLNFSGKRIKPQIEKITIPFLKAQGISTIDGLFVTHQDADHVGDLGPLLEQVNVRNLYTAKGLIANPSFQKRIAGKMAQTRLTELLAGMQVKESKITFAIVYPFKAGEGKNEDSLSLLFRLANKTWLFTGDLGQEGEKEITANFALQVNYFKLGHHGSKTSSNPEFLRTLQPEKVFISAGRNNRFGHPHPETLQTLRTLGIPWVSTQDCGMISWIYGGFNRPQFNYFLPVKNK